MKCGINCIPIERPMWDEVNLSIVVSRTDIDVDFI